MTLSAIVMAQIANVFACRSERSSIFRLGFFSNPLVLIGVTVEAVLLLLMVYTPFGHWVLGTQSLPLWVWGLLLWSASGLLVIEEGRKALAAWLNARRPAGLGWKERISH